MNLLNIFNNLTLLQKSLVVSILSVALFISSAGISYSAFSQVKNGRGVLLKTASLPGPANTVEEDPAEPKTESCPLNGQLHSKRAAENWVTRYPLAVMIENHSESRPQSGLSSADIIYEAIAEGGITRFMVLYLCNLGDIQVGPVRSARTYFLDYLSEYDAAYVHVGGANTPGPADALGQIIKYKIKDLNQFSIGFPTFWRDYQRLGHPVATEHTMYSTTQKLWAVAAKRGWVNNEAAKKKWEDTFVAWKFKDDKADGGIGKIEVDFWQGFSAYSVTWEYDPNCNCYNRKHGSDTHTDLNNSKQLSAKNVVVQFQKESRANDGYENNVHLIYKTIGEGKALIFQDGKAIEGKWSKATRVARTKFTDTKGQEISFNKGLIWIQTVPEGSKISY